ncbi:hypothetical protein [Celeribacter arenosi]|uniref:Uncharacterized protein n=1 Tax=Celeribacter arenosi TaxID=792649 RepID=A0ABP7JU68_9RHOB
MSDTPEKRQLLWHGELYEIGLEELLSLNDMPLSARKARRDTLAKIVPMRMYGDGTEAYEDFIKPHHAADPEQGAAANELFWIRKLFGEIETTHPNEDTTFFAQAAEQARRSLRDMGIDFRGCMNTVVFWSERRGRHVQIDLDLYQKLLTKGQSQIGYRFGTPLRYERNSPTKDLPSGNHPAITAEQRERAEVWLRKYPWRHGSKLLSMLGTIPNLEPKTQLWHALTVVLNHERFTGDLQQSVQSAQEAGLGPSEVESTVKDASEVSFTAGFSAAALLRKPLEYEVVKLQEAKRKRSKASGKASMSNRAKRVAAFWAQIVELAPFYPKMSEDRILEQAFDHAVEKDPDLWRQGKGQMEAYLSDDIRSKEPYKSQYYALFQKTP